MSDSLSSNLGSFAVFAGESYYADAGWRNYRGACDSPNDAFRMAAEITDKECYGWWQVVDLETRKIIAWHGRVYGDGPGSAERQPAHE